MYIYLAVILGVVLFCIFSLYDVKQWPNLVKIGIIIIFVVVLAAPKISEMREKKSQEINRDKVYLQLPDLHIALKNNSRTFFVPNIVKGKNIELRFSLFQGNKNAPEITKIMIGFPINAKVSSGTWETLKWIPSNTKGKYYLNYPSKAELPTKGSVKDLPVIYVAFQEEKDISFSYHIEADGIENIDRLYSINPTTSSSYSLLDEVQNRVSADTGTIYDRASPPGVRRE